MWKGSFFGVDQLENVDIMKVGDMNKCHIIRDIVICLWNMRGYANIIM